MSTKKVLIAVLATLFVVGCGDDDRPVRGPVQVGLDTGASTTDTGLTDTGVADTGALDVGGSDAQDLDSSPAEDTDRPDSAIADTNIEPPPGPTLLTERFFGATFTLIPGASLRTPFELTDLTTEIELFVVRELRGFNEVQNRENGRVVMAVNQTTYSEVNWVREPLPRGQYDAYIENIGGGSSNNYIAAKVIRRPTYDAADATFRGAVVDDHEFLTSGQGVSSEFTVRPRHRYVVRGLRGKNTVFIVDADQLPLLEAGQPFRFQYMWDESSLELAPEAQELDLEPGDYLLVMGNNAGDDRTHGSVVVIDEWQMRDR